MSALAEGALIHYEVEPNYAGWTLAAYVAEKLKRPLPPERLERLLRGRSLVHAEAELLPETRRSEEHTSELQSPCNLVCRLLLEKKKKNKQACIHDTTDSRG